MKTVLVRKKTLSVLCALVGTCGVWAQSKTTLTVQADKPVAEIQPTMWGVFFEDINFGADGGLYAELVKNKSFEFDIPLMGWSEAKTDRFSNNLQSGAVMIINRGGSASPKQDSDSYVGEGEEAVNPRFARVTVNRAQDYALVNAGFFGMGIKKGITYTLSVYAKPAEGHSEIKIDLINDKGQSLGSASIKPDSKDWKKYATTFVASQTFAKASLKLSFTDKSVTDIDLVSLFPSDTWKNRPGGLRADLVQLLYDLKPGFLRFPGGCIVEGRDLTQRYQWKKTVGPADERELLINRWNTEFKHRPAPDYYQSFGLGFYEYFQLAEDLGASPLPILSCGMACQFNTAEVVPVNQLDPYIQDALDLIEFANGATTTTWGKLRADMGHPQPFNLKLIGVGNEQWGPQYIERYKIFEKAIKSKYPQIKIVSGSGPFPDGEMFEYGWEELKKLNAEIIDEHYYRAPEWFFQNATRYDNYDRKGPKIFAGEYAAQSVAIASPDNKNNWQCALSEAAFMTGLERNADVVHLASYAPLFGHAEGWQWTPDLIWFDNLNAYGTPNYYVQKLFSNFKGTHTLSVKSENKNVTGQNALYSSAVWDNNTKEIIVKVVNGSDKSISPEIQLQGGKKYSDKAALTTLKSELASLNSFQDPSRIKPEESTIGVKGKSLTVNLAPYSLTVIRIKTK
jgi:alpha-L-arabinofuranosidase